MRGLKARPESVLALVGRVWRVVTANTGGDCVSQLESLDLQAAGEALGNELDKPYVDAPTKGSISGTFKRAIERPSGKYAVIEKSKEFTLVPWRETMDRNLGRAIKGTTGRKTISWTLTKGREIP